LAIQCLAKSLRRSLVGNRLDDVPLSPRDEYNEHHWPPQKALLYKYSPAEYGSCVEQQHLCGAVELSAGRRVSTRSSENNTARTHQAGKHDQDS
jgi:hypothetical protein